MNFSNENKEKLCSSVPFYTFKRLLHHITACALRKLNPVPVPVVPPPAHVDENNASSILRVIPVQEDDAPSL